MSDYPHIRAAAPPHGLTLTGASEGFELLAAEADAPGGENGKLRKFRMVAYTGAPMKVGFGWPVVVDLAGLTVPGQRRPILRDHDAARIVGHTETIEVTAGGRRLNVAGLISGVGDDAAEVVALAANGFPWQASIGASVERLEYVDRGSSVTVNGRSVSGPVYVARATTLGEVSFVPMGADANTSAAVAANAEGFSMNFDSWLAAKGFDPAAITDAQRAVLLAAFTAEQSPAPTPTPTPPPAPAPDVQAAVEEMRRQVAADVRRVAEVRRVCAAAPHATVRHNGADVPLEAHAVAEGWDATRTELEVLRANRPVVHQTAAADAPPAADVLAAAVAVSGRLASPERHFSAQTLEAADRRFRRGLGLQELLLTAAAANGYRGRGSVRGDLREVLRAAFSSVSLPGILSDSANKFLLQGFMGVDQAWSQIAARRPVNDFKTITGYRLTGGLDFEIVGPGGEIPHGTLGEESYTNKAETYGKMLAITRQDIINDDLGALTAVPQRIGRGAGTKLNAVFWTEFLDNASFFATGNSNYISGATTNLSSEGLRQGVEKLRKQTDPDGQPLALTPKFLVVPPELESIADELYTSTNVNTGGAATTEKVPNRNVFAGKYQPVVSPYLSNTSYTGYSSTAWYLLADPMDLAVIEVVFLNGVEAPTVETADADFNTLGIQMRGYFDFGVNKQEPRGGVKSKGAN